MYGSNLDKFAIAGFEGKPLPDTEDELDLLAYQAGRRQAGLPELKVINNSWVENQPRESFKTLQVVGA